MGVVWNNGVVWDDVMEELRATAEERAHEGEAMDLVLRETAEETARRYVENLQSLMKNAFGITIRIYFEAEYAQIER